METIDRTPFAEAREDLRDLLTIPLQAWLLVPPARRTEVAFRTVLDIPLDLAACGYTVTVTQGDTGWRVDLRKALGATTLKLQGEARSYVAALFQLADQAALEIDRLEKRARKLTRREAQEAA